MVLISKLQEIKTNPENKRLKQIGILRYFGKTLNVQNEYSRFRRKIHISEMISV